MDGEIILNFESRLMFPFWKTTRKLQYVPIALLFCMLLIRTECFIIYDDILC